MQALYLSVMSAKRTALDFRTMLKVGLRVVPTVHLQRWTVVPGGTTVHILQWANGVLMFRVMPLFGTKACELFAGVY